MTDRWIAGDLQRETKTTNIANQRRGKSIKLKGRSAGFNSKIQDAICPPLAHQALEVGCIGAEKGISVVDLSSQVLKASATHIEVSRATLDTIRLQRNQGESF